MPSSAWKPAAFLTPLFAKSAIFAVLGRPGRPHKARRDRYTPQEIRHEATRLVIERLSDSNVTATITLTMGFANCSGAIDATPPLASAQNQAANPMRVQTMIRKARAAQPFDVTSPPTNVGRAGKAISAPTRIDHVVAANNPIRADSRAPAT